MTVHPSPMFAIRKIAGIVLFSLWIVSPVFAFLTVDMRDHGRFLRIVGKESGDRTGIFVRVVDLVGDPTPDILVSSDFAEDYFEDEIVGRVDIFDGSTLPTVGAIDLENPIPRPALTLFGEIDNGAFGRHVEVGDFDGDGILDLAVSAPLYEANGENHSGRVYLFLGGVEIPSQGATLYDLPSDHLNATEAHVFIDGAFRRDQIGLRMLAEDFDGDGRDDLVIAAPNSQEDVPDESGRVFVVHGRSDWLATPHIFLREALDPASFPEFQDYDTQVRVIEGPHKFARIGETLASADLDGRGLPEFLLGVPNEDHIVPATSDVATFLRPGKIHLFEKDTLFPDPPALEPIRLDETRADFTFIGETEFDLFGKGMLVTDWNGDGVDDLWVGIPYWEKFPVDPEDFAEDDEGLVGLFEGNALADLPGRFPGGEVFYPTGFTIAIGGPDDDGRNEALFGSVMIEGDVYGGDGVTELVVGSSRFDSIHNDEDAGAVSVITRGQMSNRPPDAPLELEFEPETMRIFGEQDFDRFGLQIASADLFPAQGDELVVGAPQADGFSGTSGVVYIFNPNQLAFELDATVTPTFVETATPIPTYTFTPTETYTPSQTPTFSPTPTRTPVATLKFDFDRTGSVDYLDLWMFSTRWMREATSEVSYSGTDLVQFLVEMQ